MTDDEAPATSPDPEAARRAVEAWNEGCPDCHAERQLIKDETEFGIYHLWVRHDPTCPTLRYLTKNGLAE
ncbi:hypothetical protein ACX12M_02715 [Cellulosimicrobium cellulans]